MAEREVFWNICCHWLFYTLAAVSVIVFIVGCYRHVYVWLQGWPSQKTLNASLVAKAVLRQAFGNSKIVRGDAVGGIMHLFIMWGFFTLFLGTVLLAFDDYIYHFLSGPIYTYYALVLDIFGSLFILGLLIAFVRRYVIKAGKMNNLLEDPIMLMLLLAIGITGFLIEGFRLAAEPVSWMHWSPVGSYLAGLLDGSPHSSHAVVWWIHILLSLFLIGYLPYSKLFHVIAGTLNVALETASSRHPDLR